MTADERDLLPHGTLICPTCGSAHSGLIDSIICDECDNPFWPLYIIEFNLNKIKEKILKDSFGGKEKHDNTRIVRVHTSN